MFRPLTVKFVGDWLNSNIRCIEMKTLDDSRTEWKALNSNIRCIEIYVIMK